MNGKRLSERGVSLIEAMVAMVIMAIGMLGLVGLQASMRLNADVAKQRAEATRLAQEHIENWRSYGTVANFDANMADLAPTNAVGPSETNVTYTISAAVTPDAGTLNVPRLRQGSVTVSWMDRASQPQAVTLVTQVAGISPVIAGSLTTPGQGAPTRRVLGRDNAIPPGAISQPDGLTSRFTPPGSTNVVWEFSNATGVITRICDPLFVTCSNTPRVLLSGFVLFAHQMSLPSSESPTSESFPVQVVGNLTEPAETTVDCFTQQFSFYVAYYCAMPLDTSLNPAVWSGFVGLAGDDLRLAANAASVEEEDRRVCRYTPENTDTPAAGNVAHPRVYNDVTRSLANQNFLLIRAGNGLVPTPCPGDGPNPFVNTNTRLHQPSPS